MKLVMLSDTHTLHENVKVPDGDVLIHAGDLTYTGKGTQFERALRWLMKHPHPHKIVIAGNHDLHAVEFFNRAYSQGTELADAGIIFLHDQGCEIDGVKFWGSPFTPTFGRWAYMSNREDIGKHWDLIPTNTDVLITHGPPWGILDVPGFPGEQPHCGCEILHDTVFERVRPKVHVFGHIHGGYGHLSKRQQDTDIADVQFFNASVVNEDYRVVNASWVYNVG